MHDTISEPSSLPIWRRPPFWVVTTVVGLGAVALYFLVRTTLVPADSVLYSASPGDAVVSEQWSVTISDLLRSEVLDPNGQKLTTDGEWLILFGEARNFSDQDVYLSDDLFLLLPSSTPPDEVGSGLAAREAQVGDHPADEDGLLVPPNGTAPLALAFPVPADAGELALLVVPAQTAVELGTLAPLAQLYPPAAAGGAQQADDAREEATVETLLDGERVVVSLNGERQTVHLIGVDVPDPGEPFYDQAQALLAKLAEGKQVTLERDVRDRNPEGELLRYLFVGEEMVNGAQVEAGLALARTVPPNVRYREQLLALEAAARQAKRGLWAENPGGIVAPRRTATRAPSTPAPRPTATEGSEPAATIPAATEPPPAAPSATLGQATATVPSAPTEAVPTTTTAPAPTEAVPTATLPPATATVPPAPSATVPPAPSATGAPAPTGTVPAAPSATAVPPTVTAPPAATETVPVVPTETVAAPTVTQGRAPATATPEGYP